MTVFLGTLDPAQRDVFALIEIEGLTSPEAAHVCRAKLATVYTRLRLARARLASFDAGLSGVVRRGGPRDG